MILVFKLIKGTIGLRAGAEEEIEGLDVTEHGLANAYADFIPIESTLGVHSDGPVDTAGWCVSSAMRRASVPCGIRWQASVLPA